jgi:hypothetical protein
MGLFSRRRATPATMSGLVVMLLGGGLALAEGNRASLAPGAAVSPTAGVTLDYPAVAPFGEQKSPAWMTYCLGDNKGKAGVGERMPYEITLSATRAARHSNATVATRQLVKLTLSLDPVASGCLGVVRERTTLQVVDSRLGTPSMEHPGTPLVLKTETTYLTRKTFTLRAALPCGPRVRERLRATNQVVGYNPDVIMDTSDAVPVFYTNTVVHDYPPQAASC